MLSRLDAYIYTGAEDVNHGARGACNNGVWYVFAVLAAGGSKLPLCMLDI